MSTITGTIPVCSKTLAQGKLQVSVKYNSQAGEPGFLFLQPINSVTIWHD